MSDRTTLANDIIISLRGKMSQLLPDIPVFIHWDDCDMDCRTFWIFIRCPQMVHAQPKDGVALRVARALRTARAVAGPLAREKDYRTAWHLQEGPEATYKSFPNERKEFSGYSQETWVYTMTLFGGPDAISFDQLLGRKPLPT